VLLSIALAHERHLNTLRERVAVLEAAGPSLDATDTDDANAANSSRSLGE
jgi:hypothetical protein